jgi:penicillin-insensitive murein DD-endopeptidase
VRSSFQLVAAALAMALCGTPMTSAEATPPAPRTETRGGAAKPAASTRRARTEPQATLRPGRSGGPAQASASASASTEKKAGNEHKKPEILPPAESLGPPNDGRLQGGIKLDTTKPYVRIVPAYQPSDTRWGLPALVHAIDRAAKAVHKKYPGAVLGVGDISRRGGGELANHHSHESGRDADLGFYLVDDKGQPVLRHGFVKVDGLKSAAPDVASARFDMARNWLLLQNLLLDREARVSHIFVAEPIKHLLLGYARSRGVSRALVVRASQVMMQPTGGLPHDDHFHVRISCPSSMKKSCVEIAKNAPSKARLKMAKKGRGGMKTPARRVKAAAKPSPRRTAEAQIPTTTERSGGIYLSRESKAEGGPDVPVSLWALAGASLGGTDDPPAEKEGRGEAESDGADVKDAIDEGGSPRITE